MGRWLAGLTQCLWTGARTEVLRVGLEERWDRRIDTRFERPQLARRRRSRGMVPVRSIRSSSHACSFANPIPNADPSELTYGSDSGGQNSNQE